MSEALSNQSDNQPSLHHPYTKGINQRLVHPTYQRYVANEPRYFPPEYKAIGLARQDFICPICGQGIDMHHSECHHMIGFASDYGNTSIGNLCVVHRGRCHRIADEMSQRGDLVVGGTIYDAEPSQFRAGHKPPKK